MICQIERWDLSAWRWVPIPSIRLKLFSLIDSTISLKLGRSLLESEQHFLIKFLENSLMRLKFCCFSSLKISSPIPFGTLPSLGCSRRSLRKNRRQLFHRIYFRWKVQAQLILLSLEWWICLAIDNRTWTSKVIKIVAPKSEILTCLEESIKTFSGFKSRWMIPILWTLLIALLI